MRHIMDSHLASCSPKSPSFPKTLCIFKLVAVPVSNSFYGYVIALKSTTFAIQHATYGYSKYDASQAKESVGAAWTRQCWEFSNSLFCVKRIHVSVWCFQEEWSGGLEELRGQSLDEQTKYLEYSQWEKGLERMTNAFAMHQIVELKTKLEVSTVFRKPIGACLNYFCHYINWTYFTAVR